MSNISIPVNISSCLNFYLVYFVGQTGLFSLSIAIKLGEGKL